jgi:hypothetical protein
MGVHACSGAPPVVVVTCEAPLGLQVIFSLLSTSFLLLLQATNPSHLPTSSLPLLFLCCSIIAAVVMVIVLFVLVFLLWQMCHCDGQRSLPFSCFSLFRLLLLICVCERRNTTGWVLAQHIFDSLLPYSLDPA